jgi:AcrR family transcriptional regulator
VNKVLNLRDKIKEATAQEILTAAEWEVADNGLATTSMQAIARRAGVSVGTLYNYFKDKDVLLTSLFEDRKEQLRVNITNAMRVHESESFESQLESVIRATLEIFESQRNFLRILANDEKPPIDKKAKRPDRAPVMYYIDGFRPVIARGIESGVLDPEDADLYASTLAAVIRGAMIERITEGERPFVEAVPYIMRFFLNGARKR